MPGTRMSPFITYALIAFMAAYGLVLAVDLVSRRAWKPVLLQVGILGLVIVLLHLAVDFPIPRRAFGGAAPLIAVVIMLVCTILGMAAQHVFYMEDRGFSWLAFVRPIVISPIVLLPLLGSVLGTPQLTNIQLVSFGFLAFQNGFFWKVVLERAKPKV